MTSSLKALIEHQRFSRDLTTRFDDLDAYLLHCEQALADARASHRANITIDDIRMQAKGETFSDEEIERAQDEIQRFDDTFPAAVRASNLMLVYSNLEHCISKTLDYYKSTLKEPPNNFAHGFLYKTQGYLAESGWKYGSRYWEEVLRYVRVRNALVHGGGDVSDKSVHRQRETEEAVDSLSTVDLVGGKIMVSKDAPPAFLRATKYLCFAIARRIDD